MVLKRFWTVFTCTLDHFELLKFIASIFPLLVSKQVHTTIWEGVGSHVRSLNARPKPSYETGLELPMGLWIGSETGFGTQKICSGIGRLQFQMLWINYAKDSRVHSILIHVIRCICFQDILSVCGLWDLIFSNFDWNNFFFDTTVNGSSRIWCETKWLKAMIRQI